jgi:hypothetical protein
VVEKKDSAEKTKKHMPWFRNRGEGRPLKADMFPFVVNIDYLQHYEVAI